MQTLVFDRQVLESVAEILKRTFESDILLLRRESDFASSQQFGCAVQICRSARRCGLLSDKAPLSTYNLALATLHSFTRSDDVGYLAMAALLRNEMRESGCLGLLVERLFGSSAPAFISSRSKTDADMSLSHFGTDCGMAGLKHRGKSSHASDGFNAATADDDDMWMDFDLPEESKGINTFSRPKQRLCRSKGLSSSDAGSSISSKDRQMLASEPDASKPTYASIALELEILRFCATASADNQDEILQADACIPSLLSTLAICQQVSMKAQGQQLVQALETAALVLQLLVNLSNSSPEFCARFNACRGLDVVVKSIVFVSQSMGTHQHRRNAECFSHRSGAIAGDASDLRYDILLITSALLTNIVEADPSSATRFGFIRQSPSCSLSERCYPECKCSARLSLVALLAQTFAACHAVPTSTDAAVAAGYLSVLLGFLMRELPSLRSTVLDYLPERQVAIVVSHIEQFIRVSGSISKHFNGLLGGFGKIPGLSLGLSGYDSSSRSIPKHSAAVLADDGSNATSSALARNSNISSGTAATPMDCSLQAIIDALNCM
ncbi:hypothetical protein GGI12_002192 [Dipsacomyces acuminosporus]|nr:hypothetical protein GGI12_002192 [Dipsacomyces acuminosporus]